MINRELLGQILKKTFKPPVASYEIVRLPGDASDRVYYRLTWRVGSQPRSCILMAMSDTSTTKTSEKVNSDSSSISGLPFINIQKHLFKCKIAVPEIFFYDETQGWLLLEDLGETTFADQLERHPNNHAVLIDLYQHALDVLIAIQLDATPVLKQATIAHTRHFDQGLFEWEFDHFIEYGIEKRNGNILPSAKKKALQTWFSEISARLAALPQCFTHRDYHSRNLMVQQDPSGVKIRVIDFQDALMGPQHYDLASLLKDSYVDLPEAVIETLLDYYLTQWQARSGQSLARRQFVEIFDLMSIQRNLKAAGRFIYIDQVKGKKHLLPYVTPTLFKVKQTLQKYVHLKPLYDLLAEVVPELSAS